MFLRKSLGTLAHRDYSTSQPCGKGYSTCTHWYQSIESRSISESEMATVATQGLPMPILSTSAHRENREHDLSVSATLDCVRWKRDRALAIFAGI